MEHGWNNKCRKCKVRYNKEVKYIENIYLEFGISCATEIKWYKNFLLTDYEKLTMHIEDVKQQNFKPSEFTKKLVLLIKYS